MDQPTVTICFYVVTNQVLFGIWEARESDLEELFLTHPGYAVVQCYGSREEAEAHIREMRHRKSPI